MLHHSLVAAAAASHDPETALDLINEAGWDSKSDFFSIRDWGITRASETLYQITAQGAARQLIERVAQKNPHQAQTLLETKIPKHLRSTIVEGTSIKP